MNHHWACTCTHTLTCTHWGHGCVKYQSMDWLLHNVFVFPAWNNQSAHPLLLCTFFVGVCLSLYPFRFEWLWGLSYINTILCSFSHTCLNEIWSSYMCAAGRKGSFFFPLCKNCFVFHSFVWFMVFCMNENLHQQPVPIIGLKNAEMQKVSVFRLFMFRFMLCWIFNFVTILLKLAL